MATLQLWPNSYRFFSFWDYTKDRCYAKRPKTQNDLKKKTISDVIRDIDEDTSHIAP